MRSSAFVVAGLALLLGAGCEGGRGPETPVGDAAVGRTGSPVDSTPAGAPAHPRVPRASGPDAGPSADLPTPAAGATVRVPAGIVLAGAPPGAPGRDPANEMDGEPVQVGEFEIDLLPYPDDPAQAPAVDVAHDRAARLCAEQGKRLCHELEWERACEGDSGQPYPYGESYDEARYADLLGSVSPFGVLGMGAVAEWTASPWGTTPEERERGMVVRGPRLFAPTAGGRRCASRHPVAGTTRDKSLGFRCCRGAPGTDAAYVTDPPRHAFRRIGSLCEVEQFQKLVRSIPELSKVHDDPQLFSEGDLMQVLNVSGYARPQDVPGMELSWQPVRWIPTQGEELLVLSGRDDRTVFVTALYKLPGETYRYAAGYFLLDWSRPVVLGFGTDRRFLQWLPCIECRDGGHVTYEEGRVSITQRW